MREIDAVVAFIATGRRRSVGIGDDLGQDSKRVDFER
jgi:hypothetical protein